MITPKNQEITEVKAHPINLTKDRRTKLIAKATELFDKTMTKRELMDKLQMYYFKENKHYTQKQLKEIVDSVEVKKETPSQIEEV